MTERRGLLATIRTPLWAHILPFVAWLLLMQILGEPTAWKYAVRTAVCLGLFCYLRPWQHYGPLRVSNLVVAAGAGAMVFFIWIALESPWATSYPAVQRAYLLFGVMPAWEETQLSATRVYAPETAGWLLTLVRLLGSGLVIAVIEEFFWRGFLYRWFIDSDFLTVDLAAWDWKQFALVALLFGLEHQRWLVGLVAGVVYGAVMLRTRDVWATSLCHAVTNVLLGVYVVRAEQYQFWG